jgi:hypothetical protein
MSVAGRKKPVFRERVYCYELYHHLRVSLGDDFPYKLDGEVDKVNHPLLRSSLATKKPDFIVHVPGDMDRNLAVIEVKPRTTSISRLDADLRTLQGFLDEANYHRAIMLIYGDGEGSLRPSILQELRHFQDKRMLSVWHMGPKTKPTIVPSNPHTR